MPPVLPPSGRRRLRALAALIAVGLVAGACSASGHRATPPARPATSAPATTSTTAALPVYAPSPYTWTRVAAAPLAVGGGSGATLSAVLAPQLTGIWTIVGTRLSASGNPTATVWTSSDARTWRAAPLEVPPGLARALGATQYRGTTTVVGSVGAAANQQAAAWYSPAPGAAFTPAEVPLTSGASTMSEVAVGTLGTFAAGTADGRFALWSSSDGRHWNELSQAEKVITAVPGARVNSLLTVGDSVYAAGSVRRGPWTEAALWASTDGLHWRMVTTAAAAFSGPGDRVIYSLAPFETGLVAVGAVNLGSGWVPASWISPDGLSWSQPAVDFPGAPAGRTAAPYGLSGGAAARSVAAITTLAGSTALVATGGGPGGQAAWQSTDGMHWAPLALPGPAATSTGWRPGAAAATADTTVLIDSDPGRPYVLVDGPAGWSQPSSNPAVFGPVRPEGRPVALTRSGSSLVLEVDEVSYPQTIGPATSRPIELTSLDGRSWTSVRPSAAVAALYPPSLPAAGVLTARVPGGWVAAGPVSARHPAVWDSPTGTTWTADGYLDPPAATAGSGSHAGPSAATAAAEPATVTALCQAAGRSATGSTSTAGSTAPPSTAATPSITASTTSASGSNATASTAASTTTAGSSATTTATPSRARATVVAVGAVTVAGPAPTDSAPGVAPPTAGRSPVAWVSTAGRGWRRANVASPGPAGSISALTGCTATPTGLVAYGTAATSSGAPAPGLWRSTDGSSWVLQPVSAFAADLPNPLVSLAAAGRSWLAAANADPAAAATAGRLNPAPGAVTAPPGSPVGPASAVDSDSLVGPSAADVPSALWLSSDAGSSWQLVDTAVAPWPGREQTAIDAVAFAAGRPVVAGEIDGQLAVWTGTPAAGASLAG